MLPALFLAAVQTAQPIGERIEAHASLHPAGTDLYFEIPDLRAALAAYARAPAIKTVESEGAANIAALAKDLGFDLQSVVGSLLPVADPARPDDRWWPWSAGRRASISLGGIEAAPKTGSPAATPSAWMVVDFAAADAAEQAAKALVAMGGKDPVAEGDLSAGGVTAPILRIGSPFEPVLESAWLARLDKRLVLGAGDAKAADFVARAQDAAGGLAPTWRADDAAKRFGAPTGVTVLEILSDMDDLPAFARAGLSGSIASYALFFVAPFTCAKGRWRIDLEGDRFVTQGLYEPRGPARDLLAPFGATKLSERAAQLVPPEAVGCWITSVDAASAESALGSLFLQVLAESEAKVAPPAADDARMADGLGSAMAVSLLPLQGLMSPTPRLTLTLELKDAARFQSGLESWLERAQAAFPSLKIERKPFRKVPMIVLGLEEEAGALPPDASPFGVGLMEPSRITIVVFEDRVVFASAPTVARNEIKRLQDKGATELHKIADATTRPPDAFEASTMDWTGLLSKIYDGARGFAPMMAQNLDKPIDFEKLPTATQLFAAFRPTKSWARRVEGRIHSWSESSFGPETPIGLAGLGFLGAKAARAPRSPSAPEAPEPTETSDAQTSDAKLQSTLGALREVRTSIVVYRSQFGGGPATLEHLLEKTAEFPDGFLPGGKVPADAWGRALVYRTGDKGSAYTLRSTGPDGIDQDGAGDDVRLP